MSIIRKHSDEILTILQPFRIDPIANVEGAIDRIQEKLRGDDFKDSKGLSEREQVSRLIKEATNLSSLCQMFKGWCPWW